MLGLAPREGNSPSDTELRLVCVFLPADTRFMFHPNAGDEDETLTQTVGSLVAFDALARVTKNSVGANTGVATRIRGTLVSIDFCNKKNYSLHQIYFLIILIIFQLW